MAVGRWQAVAVLATALGILSIMHTASVCLWVCASLKLWVLGLHTGGFMNIRPSFPLSGGLRFELCWPARRQDSQVLE